MAKRWPKGQRPLRPIQLEFIRRLERGDATAEQALLDLKITQRMFGYWLQTEVFQRRYQRALQQVKARAISVEATAQLRQARKKLGDDAAGPSPAVSVPFVADDSPMAQRLLDLHGSTEAIEEKGDNGSV